eukprot:COSAG02_NODE_848_length_16553_cov_21.228577_9_plen_117_part_00
MQTAESRSDSLKRRLRFLKSTRNWMRWRSSKRSLTRSARFESRLPAVQLCFLIAQSCLVLSLMPPFLSFGPVQHLAQDAYVAKLKLKHEQERQMEMLKRGKKPDTSALNDGVLKVS